MEAPLVKAGSCVGGIHFFTAVCTPGTPKPIASGNPRRLWRGALSRPLVFEAAPTSAAGKWPRLHGCADGWRLVKFVDYMSKRDTISSIPGAAPHEWPVPAVDQCQEI